MCKLRLCVSVVKLFAGTGSGSGVLHGTKKIQWDPFHLSVDTPALSHNATELLETSDPSQSCIFLYHAIPQE